MTEHPTAPAPTAKGQVTTVEPTRAQRSQARRIAEAKATIPDVTLHAEAAASGDDLEARVIRACGVALRDVPRANGSYRDATFELYSRVNVGFAVWTDDALVVPTIFDADAKPLEQIASERAALAERVASGAITSPELAGGTFTVVDLGVHGATAGTAVIHGGQAGVLAFGAVRDGRVGLTLTCDARILYGPDAMRLLARIAEALNS